MLMGSSAASPASQQPHHAVYSSFHSAVPGSPYYIAVGPRCRPLLLCHLRTLPYVEASPQNRSLLLCCRPTSRHPLHISAGPLSKFLLRPHQPPCIAVSLWCRPFHLVLHHLKNLPVAQSLHFPSSISALSVLQFTEGLLYPYDERPPFSSLI